MTFEEKREEDKKRGIIAELLFVELETLNGYECFKATEFQDKIEHWDYALKKNGIFERVDIKCIKDFYWIEYKNVDGYDGWILSRPLDSLAFETINSFLVVKRIDLLELCDKNLALTDVLDEGKTIYFDTKTLDFYQRYQRKGRKDITIKVPEEDILKIISRTVHKRIDAK